MNIPWDLIFDALFKLLDDCDETPEKQGEQLDKRPALAFFPVTEVLEDQGLRGKDLRKARRSVIRGIKEASVPELTAFATGGFDAMIQAKEN